MGETNGSDTQELDKSTAVGNTTSDNKEKPAKTNDNELKATFHPGEEDRFATIASVAQAKQQKQAKQRKEKALSNQSSKVSGFVAGIAIIGALAALGGVGYLWNEGRVEKAKLEFEKHNQQVELEAQRTQLAALQSTIDSLQKELGETKLLAANVQSDSNLLNGRLSAIEGQIAEMTGSHRIDWMLKEVEHFIMVAERRLSLLGDVNGAQALMFEADQLVREMAEPAARPLRKAVQEDLYALNQAAEVSVDTEGLFTKLGLLNDKVGDLKISSIKYEMELTQSPTEEIVPEDGLAYAWYEIKHFFKSLVRVQHVTENEIKPLLLQDQQAFIEQNIRLLLEQAQLALLRGDQIVYNASLKEVANRINTYLRTNTSESQAFLKTLAELRQEVIDPAVPSIENSVRAVQVFRDYWQKEKVERQLSRAAIKSAVQQSQPVEPQPASEQQ